MEHAFNISQKNIIIEHTISPQSILQKANEKFFISHFMYLDFLKNHPEFIPTLAEWIYKEWHSYDASLTKEKLILSFTKRLQSNALPITFVVVKNNRPIATISIKTETSPEFADFPKNSLWLSSLQVVPEERNQGIGKELVKCAQMIAKHFGHNTLYCYTSNPKNVQWYLKRGAQVIEKRLFRSHDITIMKLNAEN